VAVLSNDWIRKIRCCCISCQRQWIAPVKVRVSFLNNQHIMRSNSTTLELGLKTTARNIRSSQGTIKRVIIIYIVSHVEIMHVLRGKSQPYLPQARPLIAINFPTSNKSWHELHMWLPPTLAEQPHQQYSSVKDSIHRSKRQLRLCQNISL
jgi:hypothetical protein